MPSIKQRIKGLFGNSDQPIGQQVGTPQGAVFGTPVQPDSPLFTANPKEFILNNGCVLVDGYSQGHKAFDILSMGGRTKGFISKDDHRITAKLVSSFEYPTHKNIKAMAADKPWDREFYYLPWSHDVCSFGNIKSGVEFLLTGPLSGCNVYIARASNQPPILFHANANDRDGGSIADNVAEKDRDVQSVLSVIGGTVVGKVVRGQYNKDDPAFIWGHKTGERWTLYIHSARSGTSFTNTQFYDG